MPSPLQLLSLLDIAAQTGMSLWWVDKRLRLWERTDLKFGHIGRNTGKRWRQVDVERKLPAELSKD